MNYYPYYYSRPIEQDAGLITDIQTAINGEYSAIQCYEKLAQLALKENERDRILEIRQDEIRHFQRFAQIYTQLAGREPHFQVIEECPDTYFKGLEFAFLDEQKTVDSYLEIASKAREPHIKDAFRLASADEQNHAVWFLYFVGKQGI